MVSGGALRGPAHRSFTGRLRPRHSPARPGDLRSAAPRQGRAGTAPSAPTAFSSRCRTGPGRTQEAVRETVDTVYGTGPRGPPGDDDLGTLSTWYVFSALGPHIRTSTPSGAAGARAAGPGRAPAWSPGAAR
ncbi:glycoside hydrolase domain-containing protein [Streptomyces sp. NRRL WC-3549]|uniref:glycoside hydrolase domain-containing protein n=1 Tax=Streptomyces sp. NRRL WC-3549 TaxID=1463925 RepID=UPI0009E73385|nr:glycoside hydrolase domain-containing protein [Streptomyces sp. NRRL WC-3549]